MDVNETIEKTVGMAKGMAKEATETAVDIAKDTTKGAVETAKNVASDVREAAQGALDTAKQAKEALDTDGNGKLNAQEVLSGLGARIDKTVVAAGTFAGEIKQAFDANNDGKVTADELGAVAKSAANFIGTTARVAMEGVQGIVGAVADKAKDIVDDAKARVEVEAGKLPETGAATAASKGDVVDVKIEYVESTPAAASDAAETPEAPKTEEAKPEA